MIGMESGSGSTVEKKYLRLMDALLFSILDRDM